uniref:Band 7 domain-containing protein n=1 Tax=Globodera rostochiensis TaxID=31243 RepID=A0A914HEX7_GLORO
MSSLHRESSRTSLPADDTEPHGFCSSLLIFFSYILVILTFPITVFACVKIVQQYERAVIFRVGKLKRGGAVGPGLFFIIPCIDEYRNVDMRTMSFDVPPQEILCKDSVTVTVDAVIYFRVFDATKAVVNIEDAAMSTKLLAQTMLRSVLGTRTLSEMLSKRDEVNIQIQKVLDEPTDNWGVRVERVEVKDVRLPRDMQRAMAAEAEAGREARAKVVAAEGEKRASLALRDAASVISETPAALQLRYLQTLNTISAERNSTIIFPFPIDFLPFVPPSNTKTTAPSSPKRKKSSHSSPSIPAELKSEPKIALKQSRGLSCGVLWFMQFVAANSPATFFAVQIATGMDYANRRNTAFHEAGHAVASYRLPDAGKVSRVSVVETDDEAGHSSVRRLGINTVSTWRDNICAMLAGGASAQLFCGSKPGCDDDLRQAKKEAKKVAQLGRGELSVTDLKRRVDRVIEQDEGAQWR